MEHRPPRTVHAFTLVELVVSLAVLILLLTITVQMVSSTQRVWSQASNSTERFREARTAFEGITRRASQAILNTYWDYDSQTSPTKFIRQSELHFISGPRSELLNAGSGSAVTLPGDSAPAQEGYTHAMFFHAPLGFVSSATYKSSHTLLNKTCLNACGFFIDHADDTDGRPSFLRTNSAVPTKARYRLFEYRQPTEQLTSYLANYPNLQYTANGGSLPTMQYQPLGSVSVDRARQWYLPNLRTWSRPLADNVIALIVSPRYPGFSSNGIRQPDFACAPSYLYDSRGLLCKVQTEVKVSGKSASVAEFTANVLPPVLDITIVALDEKSAARYATGQFAGIPPVKAAESGGAPLFASVSSSGKNISASDTEDQFDTDLTTLTTFLTEQHLEFEVFRTAVPIRAAKFSAD